MINRKERNALMKKKALKISLIAVGALLAVVLIYFLYVLIGFSRIEDKQPLENTRAVAGSMIIGEPYSIATQNIGFGAYTADFTFFMDGGEESRAESKESVIEATNWLGSQLKIRDSDLVLLQEVDTDSTRSHHVDQKEMLLEQFGEYDGVFGVNYHSPYLLYPLTEPHGASNSGLLTLSKYTIVSSERRSLPISNGFSKFLDLDRCYTVSRIPTDNGKELVIYNVHLSAYGADESVRTEQMTMLFADMKAEYDKGNYCIAGGDFNHDFTGTSTQDLNGGATVDYGWAQPFPADLLPEGILRCTDYAALEPTCRNCDVPYEVGNFTIIVDGFLASANVQVDYVYNINQEFRYSDHNPVVMEFKLSE